MMATTQPNSPADYFNFDVDDHGARFAFHIDRDVPLGEIEEVFHALCDRYAGRPPAGSTLHVWLVNGAELRTEIV